MKYAMIATWKMSFNGLNLGMKLLKEGKSCTEAILKAINDVEENPAFHSVGYSGLPNEEGIVQCDAGYMNGNTLQVGAVGALENIIHAVDVAVACSKTRFNNVLVGEGANQFAQNHGFIQEDLRTKESLEMYQKRLNEDSILKSYDGHDTVGMVVLDVHSSMCVATSTSGLFMKKKGRIGDSPLVGSGFYCDSQIGGVCATGVGEEIMRGVLSYEVLRRMQEGASPMQACSSTVNEFNQRMIRTKGYCDAISLIAMNNQGQYGVGTNIKFAFTYANESKDAKVYIAIPTKQQPIIREYDPNLDEID